MSLVVAAYSMHHIAIGADHGCWDVTEDGTPYNGRVDPRSKLLQIPGLPVIIATVGRDYSAFIEEWIEAQSFKCDSYSCRDIAERLTEYVFALHRPEANRRLTAAGIDPLTAAFVDKNERTLGSQEILVVGFDRGTGWDPPHCWHSEYPSSEPERLNTRKIGSMEWLTAAIFAMGYNEPLKALWADEPQDWIPDVGRLTELQCIDLTRFMLNTVGQFESWKPIGTQCVFGPFDVAVVRADGVTWVDQPFQVEGSLT
jgi:hypothetical protein